MKTLVVGLGALGTVFSCMLKKNGHEVWGVDQADILQVVTQNGVKVTGIWGDHEAMLDGTALAGELAQQDFDLIIIAVKSFLTSDVVAGIQPLLSDKTYVMLAQNGYGNYEKALASIPEEQLILGRVIFGAETEEPGISRVTVVADDVLVGSPENKVDNKVLEGISAALSEAGIATRPTDEIMKYVWGKIIYNSALNPLGAVLEMTYGQLAMDGQSKVIMDGIINEIFKVLKAMDQETLWPDAEAYRQDFYYKLVPATKDHHSSMLQDIRAGRKTEIDALNGAICELGRKYGVEIIANEMMRTMLYNKEMMMRRIDD